MRDTERERGRDPGRGRSRLHAGSPTWDSIPGPWGHDLRQRPMLNSSATQVSPLFFFFKCYLFIHERERQRPRQREKQAPCREPDAGLDPGTPRSRPEPKAHAQAPSPRAPRK